VKRGLEWDPIEQPMKPIQHLDPTLSSRYPALLYL
jgi:hypothetical protein